MDNNIKNILLLTHDKPADTALPSVQPSTAFTNAAASPTQSDKDCIDTVLDNTLPPISSTAASTQQAQIITLLSYLWLGGLGVLGVYSILSYILVRSRLIDAVHDTDNIWYADHIPTPFVMGFIHPRIYIPYAVGSEELPYIIAHEKAHISHFDPYRKLLGYLLLCVYWCNPLIWIAYLCFCRDLELACDERVITMLGDNKRKAYSHALLTCSVSRHTLLQSPLAFGGLYPHLFYASLYAYAF